MMAAASFCRAHTAILSSCDWPLHLSIHDKSYCKQAAPTEGRFMGNIREGLSFLSGCPPAGFLTCELLPRT